VETFAAGCIAVLRHLAGASLLAMIALTLGQVGLRYLFGHSISWIEEISVVLLTWLAWLGATLLWLQRCHPAVDVVIGVLPAGARLMLHRLFDVTAIVLGAGLAVSALRTIDMFAGIELAGLGIDSAVKYQPIVAGGVGLACAGIVNLLRPSTPR
jgi:TRAP-type C4-dicarboxylate transport system permease small subunit